MSIPEPKLPNISLPTIRSLPSIPFVGCSGGSGSTYIGDQFGNVPDLNALQHIKTLKKSLLEQVYALIQGKLPDPTRPVPYDARAVQLTTEIAELVSTANEVIGAVTAEVNAAIEFANGRIEDLNQAKAELESVEPAARDAVQQLMIERYDRYLGELDAQVERLQSTIECIAN